MNQNFNDYDSIGQRPPIPGEETSKKFKVRPQFISCSANCRESFETHIIYNVGLYEINNLMLKLIP